MSLSRLPTCPASTGILPVIRTETTTQSGQGCSGSNSLCSWLRPVPFWLQTPSKSLYAPLPRHLTKCWDCRTGENNPVWQAEKGRGQKPVKQEGKHRAVSERAWCFQCSEVGRRSKAKGRLVKSTGGYRTLPQLCLTWPTHLALWCKWPPGGSLPWFICSL